VPRQSFFIQKFNTYYDSVMSTTSTLQNTTPFNRDLGVIGLVGLAHMISHFSQLLLAPLFPWLKDEFNVSYTELGFLMTIFFVVSCVVQTGSGFVVDRFGPRPILFAGLSLLGIAALGYSISTSYWMLAGFAVVAGVGNGVFHPVDYTLINRKVSPSRLGHAYSVHGITGSLGWALAPVLLVSLTLAYSWRTALLVAALLAFSVLAVLVMNRRKLELPVVQPVKDVAGAEGSLAFLKIPAVWMCFTFFFVNALGLGAIQAFAPEAARRLHDVPLALVAMCLTVYMLGNACGMLTGGFLASNPARCERIVGLGFGSAALISVTLAFGSFSSPIVVPVLFALMGFSSGLAAPSRDLLVKRSTPENATGRVYGVVYSGLDIGQALSPLFFGVLMDHGNFRGVLLCLALVQGVLIVSAFSVGRVRRTATVPNQLAT